MRNVLKITLFAVATLCGALRTPSASAGVIDNYFPSGIYEAVGEVSGTNPGLSINTHNEDHWILLG